MDKHGCQAKPHKYCELLIQQQKVLSVLALLLLCCIFGFLIVNVVRIAFPCVLFLQLSAIIKGRGGTPPLNIFFPSGFWVLKYTFPHYLSIGRDEKRLLQLSENFSRLHISIGFCKFRATNTPILSSRHYFSLFIYSIYIFSMRTLLDIRFKFFVLQSFFHKVTLVIHL